MDQLTAKNKKDIELLENLTLILRDYLMDEVGVNHLIEGEEFTDKKLALSIILAVDYFNTSITPLTTTPMDQFPSLSLLLDGASIFALKSAIFKYIRNAFQYNDSGVQVAVEEKAAEYERTLQRMMNEFNTKGQAIKESQNLEGCYGGFNSEYLNLYIVGRRLRKV
jgi:hypothetical protein